MSRRDDDGESTLQDADAIPSVSALDRAVRRGGLPAARQRTGSTGPQVIDPDEETAYDPPIVDTNEAQVARLEAEEEFPSIVPTDFEPTTGQKLPPLGILAYSGPTKIEPFPIEYTDQTPLIIAEMTDPNSAVSSWDGHHTEPHNEGAPTGPTPVSDAASPVGPSGPKLENVLAAMPLADVSAVAAALARGVAIPQTSTVPKEQLPSMASDAIPDENTAPSMPSAAEATIPLIRSPDLDLKTAKTAKDAARAKPRSPRKPISLIHITAAVLATLAAALVVLVKLI